MTSTSLGASAPNPNVHTLCDSNRQTSVHTTRKNNKNTIEAAAAALLALTSSTTTQNHQEENTGAARLAPKQQTTARSKKRKREENKQLIRAHRKRMAQLVKKNNISPQYYTLYKPTIKEQTTPLHGALTIIQNNQFFGKNLSKESERLTRDTIAIFNRIINRIKKQKPVVMGAFETILLPREWNIVINHMQRVAREFNVQHAIAAKSQQNPNNFDISSYPEVMAYCTEIGKQQLKDGI